MSSTYILTVLNFKHVLQIEHRCGGGIQHFYYYHSVKKYLLRVQLFKLYYLNLSQRKSTNSKYK